MFKTTSIFCSPTSCSNFDIKCDFLFAASSMFSSFVSIYKSRSPPFLFKSALDPNTHNLSSNIFSHCQLDATFSRATKQSGVIVELADDSINTTYDCVYKVISFN